MFFDNSIFLPVFQQNIFFCILFGFCSIYGPWARCLEVKRVISRGDFGGLHGSKSLFAVLPHKATKKHKNKPRHWKSWFSDFLFVFAVYGGRRFPVLWWRGSLQEALLVACLGPNHYFVGWLQELSRCLQEGQDGLRWVNRLLRWPKMVPRWLQDSPRRLQDASRWVHTCIWSREIQRGGF